MSDNLRNDLSKAVREATKGWKKQKRHTDKNDRVSYSALRWMRRGSQRISIRDVAFSVMEQAYNHASGNGKYYANARQIMYAARPLMLAKEPQFTLDGNFSVYFTQTLLKDYIEEYRGASIWKVVWDARGHLIEPYTNNSIGLGGIEVMQYIGKWTDSFEEDPEPKIHKQIETKGPVHRFGAVLFIEKEGFAEILKDADIGKKHDMAVMSTKGLPVKAACDLANAFAARGVQIYVLHDFDLAGFKIVKTLREGTRMARGTDVVDLGLRLKDTEGLENEPVEYKQNKSPQDYLQECGVTEEERIFLVEGYRNGRWLGRRVEINAMTSEQLLGWLGKELKAHSVKKVLPKTKILSSAYRRAKYLHELKQKIKDLKEDQQDIEVPDDLQKQVSKILKKSPEVSWDDAVWRIAEDGDGDDSDDDGEVDTPEEPSPTTESVRKPDAPAEIIQEPESAPIPGEELQDDLESLLGDADFGELLRTFGGLKKGRKKSK